MAQCSVGARAAAVIFLVMLAGSATARPLCSGTINITALNVGSTGTIDMYDASVPYNPSMTCTYVFSPLPVDTTIVIEFSQFSVALGDLVEIDYDPTSSYSYTYRNRFLAGVYTPASLPFSVSSSEPITAMKFTSDSLSQGLGFFATWTVVSTPLPRTNCLTLATTQNAGLGSSGVISYFDPVHYERYRYCTWPVRIPAGSVFSSC